MALSALNWRMLTPRNLPVGYNIVDYLNTVYSMGTDTTYADGTARTPGSGSAWTWTRDQSLTPGVTTACIGIPPINALNMSYIVAGDTAARTPTMNTDAYAPNAPLVGMNKNSGAYSSWINAAPFTTGQFSGFIRCFATTATGGLATPLSLAMVECQEAFLLFWNRTDTVGQMVLGAGALIDPLSGAALNAETDGRLYSILTGGATAFQANTWLSTGAGPLNSVTTPADPHFFTFNVGAVNTTRNTAKIGSFTSTNVGNFIAPNGEVPSIPLSAYFTVSGQYAGQYRQISVTKAGSTLTEWSVSGVRKGYVWGYSTQALGASCLLSY